MAPSRVFTVPVGVSTRLSVPTLPGATCVLRAALGDGVPDTELLRLHADGRGAVHVHVHPQSAASATPVLDCTDPAGTRAAFPLEVHGDADAAAQPAEDEPVPTEPVPAIDPAEATDAEIAAAGFPPRPDRTAAPEAYERWASAVSQLRFRVTGAGIAHEERRNVTFASNNWSGAVTTTSPLTPYTSVSGTWRVPAVTGESKTSADYSSMWVGLDGFGGSGDLIQCGTAQDIWTIDAPPTLPLIFQSVYSWVEYVPNAPVETPLTVSPGDTVFAVAWACDANGNEAAYGGYGCLFLQDLSSPTLFYSTTIQQPLGWVFWGNSAEWILERPLVDGSLADLARYGSAEMQNLVVGGGTTPVKLENMLMQNGNRLLSSATLGSGPSVSFHWDNFN
jgi:hypothetical protein